MYVPLTASQYLTMKHIERLDRQMGWTFFALISIAFGVLNA